MSDGISVKERHANKIIYAGKQIYRLMCDLQNAIGEARKQKITDDELGVFAELDLPTLIAEAKVIGNVPDWRAETTLIGKKLSYPQGTTGVNQ